MRSSTARSRGWPRSSTIVRRTGALDATRDAARAEADKARAALDVLPQSAYREALLELSRSIGRALVLSDVVAAPTAAASRQGRDKSGCSLAW